MWTALAVLLATTLLAVEPTPRDALVITRVSVIDPVAGISKPDRDVVLRGGRIEAVASGRLARLPRAARLVDGAGKYLMPGLWDMHVHLGGDDRTLQRLLASGITGVRDMGGDLPPLSEARRRIAAGERDGPRLVIAGPILRGPTSPSDASDAQSVVIRTAAEGRRAVESLWAERVDFVKVHEDLSRPALLAIVAAARARRLPCVGHVPSALTPREVSDLGLRSIEHLEFVPDQCLALFNPGTEGAAPVPADVCGAPALASLLQGLARRGTWLDPTISSFRYWAPQQWDAIFGGFRGVARELRRSGVGLLAGTDWSSSLQSRGARPGSGLHEELALLVDSGFTPAEALRAATSNPAAFLGLSKALGAVEAGKSADLVLLDGDPLQDIRNSARVAAVIREGRLFRVRDGELLPPD